MCTKAKQVISIQNNFVYTDISCIQFLITRSGRTKRKTRLFFCATNSHYMQFFKNKASIIIKKTTAHLKEQKN